MMRRLVLLVMLALSVSTMAALAVGRSGEPWVTYRNAKFGFSIGYPREVFEPDQSRQSEDGQLFVSRDGAARLLAGAFFNEEGTTLADYRKLVLERSYPGAEIDYSPMRGNWFVLSGTKGDTMFYERVTFTCGGRIINGWAMTYPSAKRKFWDGVVEDVAKSYKVGDGGGCPKGNN